MLRYKLRTLLIVLALGPAVIAAAWWLWMRGGLLDALDIVFLIAGFISTLAGLHFAIKENLGN